MQNYCNEQTKLAIETQNAQLLVTQNNNLLGLPPCLRSCFFKYARNLTNAFPYVKFWVGYFS